jgi:thiol-disulfide isomerase/thioredoxin
VVLIIACIMLSMVGIEASAAAVVNQPSPAFSVNTWEGQRITRTQLQGQVVVLSFWASWCEPCRTEMALFNEYLLHHPNAPVKIIMVSIDEGADQKTAYKMAQSFVGLKAFANQSDISAFGRMLTLPRNWVIDANGVVRAALFAPKDAWTAERLTQTVDALLNEAAP